MTLKQSWVSRAARAVKMSVAGVALLATAAGLTAGCLDRPVAPAKPRTSNLVIKVVTQSGVDKIDLLFMIDNSISMADKQRILAEAVPVLVQRLVDPICVDQDDNPVGGTVGGGCPGGSSGEFTAVRNIHIGVITSSLGDHGSDVCRPNPMDTVVRTVNDQAQLVPTIYQMEVAERGNLYSYQNLGFLVWDPRTPRPDPDPHPGVSNHEQVVADFVADFTTHVTATGERGCGFEASLEAWYRFLVDPEPIAQVTSDPANNPFSIRGPVNEIVLQQRAAFLRPDSLLAIVMLTDENDCSIVDEDTGQGWLVGRQGAAMPRASSECATPGTDAYDACCRPCVLEREGCPPNAADAQCALGATLTAIEDTTNLRCFQQMRRFGLDLLYPWQRYVEGLRSPQVWSRLQNAPVVNPIYRPGDDGTAPRDPNLVFLAGIIGVPWQDIADEASLTGRDLRYLTAQEMNLATPNRWDVILGDPDNNRPPTDPFMIESVDERPAGATNPVVPGEAIMASTGSGRNNINGREQNVVSRDDLQYACIFDLVPDVPCTTANRDGCDCNAEEQAHNRPLCEYAGMGMDGTQTHAKAYPGTRILQVLRNFGDNAIVASICPKNVMAMGSPQNDQSYGYNPAVGAIIERLKEALVATCLPRPLAADENNNLPCRVIEAYLPPMGSPCECNAMQGRTPVESNDPIRAGVVAELEGRQRCGSGTGVNCSDYCMCTIEAFQGGQLETCQQAANDPLTQYGYCYVEQGTGNPELLADCPPTQQQIIRFMGTEVPRKGSIAFIACLGDAASASGTMPEPGM